MSDLKNTAAPESTEVVSESEVSEIETSHSAPLEFITGFDLVADKDTRILILGSMPSVSSLDDSGYYAHPQNAFWWIMSELLNEDFASLEYAQRYALLLKHNIGLWDVIHSCQRPGSLDASIDLKTAKINDFEKVFAEYKNITTVFCNGGLAHKLFNGRVHKPLKLEQELIKLPSSSPAHANKTKEQKLKAWQVIS